MMLRAVRGAITVDENTQEDILQGVQALLVAILKANHISQEDVVSAIFSMTQDLNAVFPAAGARLLGWSDIPLFGCVEVDVPGSLSRCIRVLIHYETQAERSQVQHIYLRDAEALRPDLTGGEPL